MEGDELVPRPFVYWRAAEGAPSAGRNPYGSEFYDNSPDGQVLRQGSSVPGTKIKWLDGSWRAAASECQGPWLSGRSRWWVNAACPNHIGAYPDRIRMRLSGARTAGGLNFVQETPWLIAKRGPDPNIWIAEGLAVGSGGHQLVRGFFTCPGGVLLGCDYTSSCVVVQSSGAPDPTLAWFVSFVWADPRVGLQNINATGTVGTGYTMELDLSPHGF